MEILWSSDAWMQLTEQVPTWFSQTTTVLNDTAAYGRE
jgi:hypothetical protein